VSLTGQVADSSTGKADEPYTRWAQLFVYDALLWRSSGELSLRSAAGTVLAFRFSSFRARIQLGSLSQTSVCPLRSLAHAVEITKLSYRQPL